MGDISIEAFREKLGGFFRTRAHAEYRSLGTGRHIGAASGAARTIG